MYGHVQPHEWHSLYSSRTRGAGAGSMVTVTTAYIRLAPQSGQSMLRNQLRTVLTAYRHSSKSPGSPNVGPVVVVMGFGSSISGPGFIW